MGRAFACITYDQPFTGAIALEVFEVVLQVVRQNWLEATDEWSRGYREPLDVISGVRGAKYDLAHADFSKPDHDGINIDVLHSPLTYRHMECTVRPNRVAGEGLVDYRWAEVSLGIPSSVFFERCGDREKTRMESGWQSCRKPAWGDKSPWQEMPPRTPEFSRWWRNFEEVCAATEDVGEKNFAYFMRIVTELKKLYPVIAYEEEDTFKDYESWPAQQARWAREEAEQEARFQQEETEKRRGGLS